MRLIKQSQTAQPLVFFMAQSSDHVTGLAGASPTVTLSKNGGAFGAASGAVSEISSGWYKVAGNATDTATLGPLLLHATATSGDPTDVQFEVVAYDPQSATNLGLSALPTASAGASGGLVEIGAGSNNFKSDSSANVTFANTSIATVTTVTNQLTGSAIATAIWQDSAAGDFTANASIGKSIMNGVALGTGLTIANLTNAPTAGDFTATMKTSLNSATPTASLSVAALAAILQGVHKCANVYFVSTTGNDSNAGGVSAPFLTVNHAASVAGAADGIVIFSGSYTNTGTITFLGKVMGESRSSVILNCSLANDTAIILGNGADLRDFTIKSTVSGANFGLTINLTSGGTASVMNMHLIGVTDVFYFNGITGATLNVESCLIFTPWDWLNGEHSSSNKVFINNSIIRVIGPVVTSGTTFPTASTGFYASGMKVVIKDSTIDVTTTDTQALIAMVSADSSDVTLDNTTLRTSGGGTMIDYQTSNGGKLTLKNMAFDPSKLNLESASDLTVIAPLQSSTLNRNLSVSSTGKAAATVATGDGVDAAVALAVLDDGTHGNAALLTAIEAITGDDTDAETRLNEILQIIQTSG